MLEYVRCGDCSRVGHTMIPTFIRTIGAFGGRNGGDLLRNLFFNMDILWSQGGLDSLLTGMTRDPVESVDENFSDEVLVSEICRLPCKR